MGLFTTNLLGRALLLLFLLTAMATTASPDDFTNRRIQVGVRLFRAMLAADLDLAAKRNAQGHLTLAVVYSTHLDSATSIQKTIRERSSTGVRNFPVIIEKQPLADLLKRKVPPAGIFIANALEKSELLALVRYGIQHGVVVYSPFQGDVERGVVGGLSVEARVRPYVNVATLQQAQLRIKSFFLKVSKRYE